MWPELSERAAMIMAMVTNRGNESDNRGDVSEDDAAAGPRLDTVWPVAAIRFPERQAIHMEMETAMATVMVTALI